MFQYWLAIVPKESHLRLAQKVDRIERFREVLVRVIRPPFPDLAILSTGDHLTTRVSRIRSP